jgi:molecular chaperone DnaK
MGIGVGLPGGRVVPVLPRNTRLPARRAYELATVQDGQSEMELAVFQGDAPDVSHSEYLGTVRLTGLPPAPRGEVKLAVEFALGNEGILSVSARNLATGQVTAVRFATVDTPASLREKLQLPEVPVAPRGARPIDGDGEALPEAPAGAPAAAVSAPAAVPPAAAPDGAAPPAASAPPARPKRGLFARLLGR